jgi:SpoVK/Ycf46/Vps4 family AAA+-type ATPase
LKKVSAWHLENRELAFIQFDRTQITIRSKIKECTRKDARITFTTTRIICELYSLLGSVESTLVVYYVELVAIRTNSELGIQGLTLRDCNGDSIWFNFFRNNLRGTQIFLQCFWCIYATYNNNPLKILERLQKLHIESTVPDDLFNSDVSYDQSFIELLIQWGIILEKDKIPQVTSNASAYTTHLYPKTSDRGNVKNDPVKTGDREKVYNIEDLYKITDILAENGKMVYKGQAIIRVTSSRTVSAMNICSGETGYLEIKEIDDSYYYSQKELESLFTVRVGMKKAQEKICQDNIFNENRRSQTLTPSAAKLLEEFDSLIGLTQAKEKVKEIVAIAEITQKRKKLNLEVTTISQHMIFSGNPGTGKTTIARRLGEILKEIGILSKGHFVEVQRSDLVAGYLGQTAIKTTEVIKKALGGILFIDEAYSLSPPIGNDPFGNEAINALVAAMENHRNDLVVIVAGYPEEMNTFISSNPGLDSRFSTTVQFEDYTTTELLEIFKRMMLESNLQIGEGGEPIIKDIIDQIASNRGKGFGNAREVRKVFEKILATQHQRLFRMNAGTNELLTILPEDLLAAQLKLFPRADIKAASLDHELGELIGLRSVKQEIRKLIDVSRINAKRKKEGLGVSKTSLHMIFTGNPGTGKTTVARLVARYLFEIGCLPKNHLVEVSRADLVAGYVGQTAIKTLNKLEYALGGVLFVDEAYTLHDSSDQNNYGKESLETILKFMEDHKEEIVVILAGYEAEMGKLLDSNTGLRSRFNRFIHFDDYTAHELLMVFKKIAEFSDYTTSESFDEKLLASMERLLLQESKGFGNGRAMRNLFEKVSEKQATRLAKVRNQTLHELRELKVNDLHEHDLQSVMAQS